MYIYSFSAPDANGKRIYTRYRPAFNVSTSDWQKVRREFLDAVQEENFESKRQTFYLYKFAQDYFAFVQQDDSSYSAFQILFDGTYLTICDSINIETFANTWTDKKFKVVEGEKFVPREIFCNSSSEEIGIALSNSACRQKLFRRDGPKFDVWRGLYYVDGKPVPDTSFQFKMRYPTEASRTSCMLLIVFCALVSILNGIRLSSGILIRAPNVSLAAGFFSDKWTIIKQVFCLIGLCHLLAILMTTSFMLITVNLVFTTTVVATIGTIFGAWITVENRTVVQMFTAARTGATLRKALIPISMCFVFVLPGFLLNSYLEKEVLNLLSSVPERAEINLPSAPLLKPVVRPPVWRDGFVRYVFGIPAVDIVRFDTAEKKLVFDQLPIWRASTVAVLKALFLISFLFLFSRFIRLAIGIVLRVATTIDGQEVKYRPR